MWIWLVQWWLNEWTLKIDSDFVRCSQLFPSFIEKSKLLILNLECVKNKQLFQNYYLLLLVNVSMNSLKQSQAKHAPWHPRVSKTQGWRKLLADI